MREKSDGLHEPADARPLTNTRAKFNSEIKTLSVVGTR